MGIIPYFLITIMDGKGQISTMKHYCERFDYNDYATGDATNTPWHESMLDNLLQDIEPIIDGEIIDAKFVWPVGFDFTPQTADPDSDVEEGAVFTWETVNGYKTTTRVPTFKESLMISGTADVDLTAGPVQDYVNTILDGPDAVPGINEDRFNITDNRGEDVVAIVSAGDAFRKTRGNPRFRRS